MYKTTDTKIAKPLNRRSETRATDLNEGDFYKSGRFAVSLVLLAIALLVVYWLARSFVEEVFYKWRSDFYGWWSR